MGFREEIKVKLRLYSIYSFSARLNKGKLK